MASLFTGIYPEGHHVLYSADPMTPSNPTADVLGDDFVTLAEMLNDAGYSTAAIQTNGNLVGEFGYAQGFDTYEYMPGETAAAVTSRALEVLDSPQEVPRFLYVHYMDPHMPYAPPESIRALFGARPQLSESETAALQSENQIPYLQDYVHWKLGLEAERAHEELSPQAKEELETLYDSCIRFLDQELRRLLDRVEEAHPNTLVIVLSDHGEHFWEHGLMGHGLTLYEEEIRVPLLIRGPGIAPDEIVAPVSTIHLMPTVAHYLGLPELPQWQATQNLLAAVSEQPSFGRTFGSYPSLRVDAAMVRQSQNKLIQMSTQAELYDVHADPGETRDLKDDNASTLDALSSLLAEHAHATEELGKRYKQQPKVVDQQTLDVLKDMGYFGGNEEVDEP